MTGTPASACFKTTTIWRSVNHDFLFTGYLGRTAIFEVLTVDDSIKHLVAGGGADASRIKREAVKNGTQTLRQAALCKLADGVTTFEEVLRVTRL